MLLPYTKIASQKLLLEVAVTAKAGCSDFAACMVFAIMPVNIGSSAMIICMQQLMRQGMIDLLLSQKVVVAQYHLQKKQSYP